MPNLTRVKTEARVSQAKRAADKIKSLKSKPKVTKSVGQKQKQTIIIHNNASAPAKRKRASKKPGTKPGVPSTGNGANSKPPSSSDGILLALLDTFKKADLSREQRSLAINPPRTEAPHSFSQTTSIGAGASGGIQAGRDVHTSRKLSAIEQAERDQKANARMQPPNPPDRSFAGGGFAGGGGINKGHVPRLSAMSPPSPSAGTGQSGGGFGNAMSDSVRHRLQQAADLGMVGFIDDEGSGYF